MQRLIAPPEHRHPRVFGIVRVSGGILAAGAGVACLSHAAYGWAAFFLAVAHGKLRPEPTTRPGPVERLDVASSR